MPIKFLLLATLTIIFFNSCTVKNFQRFKKNVDENQTIKKVDNREYGKDYYFEWKITKGDRIEIQAFNQSSSGSTGELNQLLSNGGQRPSTTRVGDEGILLPPDGSVRLPLIGSIYIEGLTEDQAAAKIIHEYKKYLKNPYVSVKILNQKLFVLGEVQKPGVVLVTNGTMSLFEALAYSGDITNFADRTNIKIIRGDLRHPSIREIDLTDMNSIKFSSMILRPNDIVYVSSRDQKSSTVGYQEQLPLWNLIGSIITPISSAAIIYGVFK